NGGDTARNQDDYPCRLSRLFGRRGRKQRGWYLVHLSSFGFGADSTKTGHSKSPIQSTFNLSRRRPRSLLKNDGVSDWERGGCDDEARRPRIFGGSVREEQRSQRVHPAPRWNVVVFQQTPRSSH